MLIRMLRAFFGAKQAAPAAEPPPGSSRVAARVPAEDPRAAVLARLAAYERSGQSAVSGGHIDRAEARQAQEIPNEALAAVLERARALVTREPSDETTRKVDAFAACIRACVPSHDGPLAFVFHADLPQDASIDYVDAKLNVHDFDYLDILRRFAKHAQEHCPGLLPVLATSAGARYRALSGEGFAVVELPLDLRFPMYERAVAVSAFLRSSAFRGDTAFLDSDAFVNRPLAEVFDLGFDLAFTYRQFSNMMPVNEGVFFASPRRAEAVERFMRARLATYERIAADPAVTAYYGDVRRWRGGQLSLNAVCAEHRPYSPFRVCHQDGLRLRFLPCDTFNFALGDGEALSSSARLGERYVMHYKGPRKYALLSA